VYSCGICCVQPDVADEYSQVSLPLSAHESQADVEQLKQELLSKQQVCTVVIPTAAAAAAAVAAAISRTSFMNIHKFRCHSVLTKLKQMSNS